MATTLKRLDFGPGSVLQSVVVVEGREVGLIQKPRDTHGIKNKWRAFVGLGGQARFLAHFDARDAAVAAVAFAAVVPAKGG